MLHKPENLDRLAAAARFIAEQMDHHLVLSDHKPGYLVVHDDFNHLLLACAVGDTCKIEFLELASQSNKELCDCRKTDALIDGTTSSDTDKGFVSGIPSSGSVAAKQLIVGYGSKGGVTNPQADEAIAIMIAIRAKLLSKNNVRDRYRNRSHPQHNPYLRRLIDNITWTD